MKADGSIVIETVIDTSKFEKQYDKLQSQLEKEELKLEVKTTDLENAKQELKETEHQLKQIINRRKELNSQLEALQSKFNSIQARIDSGEGITGNEYQRLERAKEKITNLTKEQNTLNKEYEKYNGLVNKVNYKLEKTQTSYDIQKSKIEDIKNAQELVNIEKQKYINKIEEENQKLEQQQAIKRLEEQKNKLSGIKNETDGIIKKITKWGLALFSIRSAYTFIRSSVGILSQYNEKIGTDIEYIRWAIANSLQPIIEYIIKLVYLLLRLINSITMSLFGINLFANSSADAFKRAKENISGSNKQAKELQKTLAGFDEMNILQQDGSTGTGGGGGGVSYTPPDLSNMFDDASVQIKKWWDDIVKFWEEDWYDFFSSFGGNWGTFIYGIGETLKGFWEVAQGIGELIIGLAQTIFGLITGDTELTKQGIGIMLDAIKNLILGFFNIIMGILTLKLGLIKGIVGTIIGEIFNIVGDFWDGITDFFGNLFGAQEEEKRKLIDLETATNNLRKAEEKLKRTTDDYTYAQDRATETANKLKEAEEKYKINAIDLYKEISTGTKSVDRLSEAEMEVYKAYLDNEDASTKLFQANEELVSTQGELISSTGQVSGAIYQETRAFDENFKTMAKGYEEGKTSSLDARNYILSMMKSMDDETQKVFIKNIPNSIRSAFDNTKYANTFAEKTKLSIKEIGDQAKTTFDQVITNSVNKTVTAVSKLSTAFKNVKNQISQWTGGTIKFSVGGVGYAKGGIVTKLATGGIVNNPGRGVPVASSRMGEAGREGILPLTDSQAMETLGQAIGRYISLNATIPVYMGNRQIAREIRKIEADDDFAYNG